MPIHENIANVITKDDFPKYWLIYLNGCYISIIIMKSKEFYYLNSILESIFFYFNKFSKKISTLIQGNVKSVKGSKIYE